MSKLNELLTKMDEVHNDCASLMKKAKLFSASKDPKLRALAYEISVNVSRIMSEQRAMLKEIQEISAEVGAMAN